LRRLVSVFVRLLHAQYLSDAYESLLALTGADSVVQIGAAVDL
jgi:hypothetical protein